MPEIPVTPIEEATSTLPQEGKRQRKRKANPKHRRHIYLKGATIEKIEKKAAKIADNNFSMMTEILVALGMEAYDKLEKDGKEKEALSLYFSIGKEENA